LVQATLRHRGLLLVLLAVAVYTVAVGWILSLRYWAFQTYAWDLGNYNQGLFTATFQHRLFYYTADLPSGNIGSLLAAHFSPILFLLIPFYAIDPGPSALLFIQTAALAAGALPLYLLSRRLGLPDGWSLLVAGAYLVSPVLMGVGWYDFHPEAFIPATVLWAVYCYYYSGRWTFVIAWLLALSVIETVAPLLFLFALASLVAFFVGMFQGRSSSRLSWEKTAVAAVLSPLWLGVAALASQLVNHGGLGTLGTGYSSAYSILGPNLGFIDVVPYAILHPSAAYSAIAFEGDTKFDYVLVLLGSLAFLPLFGPKRLLLPAAAWLVLVILSNGTSLFRFGDQYAAYALPFLAAGMPFGLVRIRTWWKGRGTPDSSVRPPRPYDRWRIYRRKAFRPVAVAVAIVVAVVVTSAMVSPLLVKPYLNYAGVSHGIPSVTAHDQALHAVINLIPDSAGVVTVSAVFPEVSSRANAYVVPISSSFVPDLTFDDALDDYINESSYVLLDFQVDFFGSSVLVRFGNLSGFGILAEESQITLLERGWSAPPVFWVPYQFAWGGGDLSPTQFSYVDPSNSTSYGPSLSSSAGPPEGALLWYGPYTYGLTPGEYTATFWLSVSGQSNGTQVGVEVVSNPLYIGLTQQGDISAQHAYGFQFSTEAKTVVDLATIGSSSPGTVTANVSVTFHWDQLDVWSVAGLVYANDTTTHLFAVTLNQTAP